jgi:iron complex outermembrane recepter protein
MHNKVNSGLLLSTSVMSLVLSGVLSSHAFAQDVPGASEGATIEEVVVTARKREESLQTVPVAVSSVTGRALEQQSIRQPTDLSRTVPSLRIVNSSGTVNNASVTLRGQVAGDVLLNVSQPVGMYEDSVNIPHPIGANISFFDLTRVEVLKGPQGTLYGRNTTGGAINIITRSPDFDGLHGFIQGEVGNYDSRRLGAAANIPLIDDVLAIRVAYQHWRRDGYGKSIFTGQRMGGDRDDDLARLSVHWTPTSTLTVDAKFEYAKADRNGELTTTRAFNGNRNSALEAAAYSDYARYAPIIFANRANLANPATPAADPIGLQQAIAAGTAIIAACINGRLFESCQGTNGHDDVETRHGVLDVNWDVTENIRLRSITGYHQFESRRAFDLDSTRFQLLANGGGLGVGGVQPDLGSAPLPWPAFPHRTHPDQQSDQVSQEFNLSGDWDDGRLNWLVGGFWADDDGKGAGHSILTPTVATARGVSPTFSAFDPLKVTNTTWALFTQNDIRLSDRVSLTLGARYTEEKLGLDLAAWSYSSLTNRYSCLAGPFSAGPGRVAVPQIDGDACVAPQSAKFSGTSYLGSFNFQVTPDILVYLRTARGFRGGALQGRAADQPPAAPEIATDYEIGFKGDLLQRRLRANVALYQTNYKNKQEQTITINALGAPTTILRNAAQARIQGLEAELRALLFEGFQVFGSGSYTHAEYRKFPNALTPQSVPATPCTTCIDAAGVPFAVPKYQMNVGARYQHDLGPGRLALTADYSWRGRTPITALNRDLAIPLDVQQDFFKPIGLVNARVEYELDQHGLTAGVFVTNLTDKHYQQISVSPLNLGGVTAGLTREPRMWGVSLRKAFGSE